MSKRSKYSFFLSLFAFGVYCQTTLYDVMPDGTMNKYSYLELIHQTGTMVIHNESTGFENDTVKNWKVIVDSSQVRLSSRPSQKISEPIVANLGYLAQDKRIIVQGENESDVKLRGSFVKDKMIFDANRRLVAFIEGEEIYGVALYLMSGGNR